MARHISPGEWGVVHRGATGLWSFIAHRVTGIALAMFFVLVVLDTAMVFAGAEFYNRFRAVYDNLPFHLVELAVLGALLYHGLNGLRTVAIDIWPRAARAHRSLFDVQMGVFFALFVPAAWVIVARFFA